MLRQAKGSDPCSQILIDDSTIRSALCESTFDFSFEPLTLAHKNLVLSIKRSIGEKAEIVEIDFVVAAVIIVIKLVNAGSLSRIVGSGSSTRILHADARIGRGGQRSTATVRSECGSSEQHGLLLANKALIVSLDCMMKVAWRVTRR